MSAYWGHPHTLHVVLGYDVENLPTFIISWQTIRATSQVTKKKHYDPLLNITKFSLGATVALNAASVGQQK